jgi:hypothetical protein
MPHAPGPWTIDDWTIYGQHGDPICTIDVDDTESIVAASNACLIAAAPELLDAAKTLSALFFPATDRTEIDPRDGITFTWNDIRPVLLAVRLAIIKATA